MQSRTSKHRLWFLTFSSHLHHCSSVLVTKSFVFIHLTSSLKMEVIRTLVKIRSIYIFGYRKPLIKRIRWLVYLKPKMKLYFWMATEKSAISIGFQIFCSSKNIYERTVPSLAIRSANGEPTFIDSHLKRSSYDGVVSNSWKEYSRSLLDIFLDVQSLFNALLWTKTLTRSFSNNSAISFAKILSAFKIIFSCSKMVENSFWKRSEAMDWVVSRKMAALVREQRASLIIWFPHTYCIF